MDSLSSCVGKSITPPFLFLKKVALDESTIANFGYRDDALELGRPRSIERVFRGLETVAESILPWN